MRQRKHKVAARETNTAGDGINAIYLYRPTESDRPSGRLHATRSEVGELRLSCALWRAKRELPTYRSERQCRNEIQVLLAADGKLTDQLER